MRFPTLTKAVCNPDHPESYKFHIVLVIITNVDDFKKRETYRKKYASITNRRAKQFRGLRPGMVFVVGEPRDVHEDAIRREVEEHDDLVIGDFKDTPMNDSLKKYYSFAWASMFCRKSRPTFLYLDRGSAFSIPILSAILSKLNETERGALFHGKVVFNKKVDRYGKLKVSYQDYPWPSYPPYIEGEHMLIGFDTVERLALGMHFTRIFNFADAWIALTAARLGIYAQNIYSLTSGRIALF